MLDFEATLANNAQRGVGVDVRLAHLGPIAFLRNMKQLAMENIYKRYSKLKLIVYCISR